MAAPAEEFEEEEVAEVEATLEEAPEAELEEAGLPAWLDEMEPLDLEDEAAEEAPAAEEPAEVAPEEAAPEAPAVTAGEKVSIHDTLEWLNDIGSLEAEPEEGLEGDTLPMAETESGPQWLREVGMLQPEEQAGPEDLAEEPEPESEPEAEPEARFSFQDFEPRWARHTPGSTADQPPASLPEESAGSQAPEAAEDDLSDSPPWLDEDSGPAWLRRVIEEEDDSEG